MGFLNSCAGLPQGATNPLRGQEGQHQLPPASRREGVQAGHGLQLSVSMSWHLPESSCHWPSECQVKNACGSNIWNLPEPWPFPQCCFSPPKNPSLSFCSGSRRPPHEPFTASQTHRLRAAVGLRGQGRWTRWGHVPCPKAAAATGHSPEIQCPWWPDLPILKARELDLYAKSSKF